MFMALSKAFHFPAYTHVFKHDFRICIATEGNDTRYINPLHAFDITIMWIPHEWGSINKLLKKSLEIQV